MDAPTLLPTSRPPAPPAGFALPAIVLGLALLAMLASTGFLVSWLETRSSAGFVAGTRAFYVADGGLATALADTAPPPAIVIGPGIARVRLRPLLALGPGERLVRFEADGSVAFRGDTTTRRVMQEAWLGDPPRAPAALLAADPASAATAVGTISGVDAGACGAAAVAGIASWRPITTGAGLAVLGSPPVRTLPASTGPAALTGLRWDELLSTFGPTVDAVVPPDPWPGTGPSTLVRLDAPGPLGAAHAGEGALLATGDLVLADGFRWSGLILVGGSLSASGRATIRGAVLTGLDSLRAGATDLGPGPLDLAFDACAVTAAAARLVPLPAAVPGMWRERW